MKMEKEIKCPYCQKVIKIIIRSKVDLEHEEAGWD